MSNPGSIILVTGGSRSGKSEFAEQYAATKGRSVAYIATAQIYDAEMQDRVQLHQQRRPAEWETFEAPYAAEKAIRLAAARHDVILFDCLTLYTTNLLLAEPSEASAETLRQTILAAINALLEAAAASAVTVIFVTNEVGLGIIPDNALARKYRDMAGLVNQAVAAAAQEVYLVVCGVPVELKQIAVQLNKGE